MFRHRFCRRLFAYLIPHISHTYLSHRYPFKMYPTNTYPTNTYLFNTYPTNGNVSMGCVRNGDGDSCNWRGEFGCRVCDRCRGISQCVDKILWSEILSRHGDDVFLFIRVVAVQVELFFFLADTMSQYTHRRMHVLFVGPCFARLIFHFLCGCKTVVSNI